MPVDITNRLSPEPTPGLFYSIRAGDTLLGVAGRAYGLKAGSERLEAARWINGARYNDRFRGNPTQLFPDGQLSFMPRFDSDPNVQAATAGRAPGHTWATLWIPKHAGDEPTLMEDDDEDLDPYFALAAHTGDEGHHDEPTVLPPPRPEPDPGFFEDPAITHAIARELPNTIHIRRLGFPWMSS